MKLLMENWRIFIKEEEKEEGDHGFKYLSASPWSAEDAEQEWGEEVITSLDNGAEYINQRWPGLTKEIIEKKYPYLLNVEDFIDALAKAPLENLSLPEMREIHNHAQVHEIIDLYNAGNTSGEVYDKTYAAFGEYASDHDKSGKSYPKEKSYQRWVDKFKDSDSIDKPSIALELPNGKLAHVGGHTRQTGALTNEKISPYAVLYPLQQHEDLVEGAMDIFYKSKQDADIDFQTLRDIHTVIKKYYEIDGQVGRRPHWSTLTQKSYLIGRAREIIELFQPSEDPYYEPGQRGATMVPRDGIEGLLSRMLNVQRQMDSGDYKWPKFFANRAYNRASDRTRRLFPKMKKWMHDPEKLIPYLIKKLEIAKRNLLNDLDTIREMTGMEEYIPPPGMADLQGLMDAGSGRGSEEDEE